MRCDDVIRELAARGDEGDASIADHLGACAPCAEWSSRMASWDRLWDQTRPVEPSAETWDAAWSRLERELEVARGHGTASSESVRPGKASPAHPLGTRTLPSGQAPSQVPILGIQRGIVSDENDPIPRMFNPRLFLALAAAMLIAAVGIQLLNRALSSARNGNPAQQVAFHGGPTVSPPSSLEVASVDIGEGELIVIRSADARGVADAPGLEVTQFEADDGIDAWYVMFNAIESMANPVVAAR